MKIKKGALLAYQEHWPYASLVLETKKFGELHQKRCKECRTHNNCWTNTWQGKGISDDENLLVLWKMFGAGKHGFCCALESAVKTSIEEGKIILF